MKKQKKLESLQENLFNQDSVRGGGSVWHFGNGETFGFCQQSTAGHMYNETTTDHSADSSDQLNKCAPKGSIDL